MHVIVEIKYVAYMLMVVFLKFNVRFADKQAIM